jgi:ABC-type multidrug transport system fused ATPase/permease subunit
MNIFSFIKSILKEFPVLLLLNIVITILIGIINIFSIVSVAPVIDMLINAETGNMSGITKKMHGILYAVNIPTSFEAILLIFISLNFLAAFANIFLTMIILKIKYAITRKMWVGTQKDFFNAKNLFFTSQKQGTFLNTFINEMRKMGDAVGHISFLFASISQTFFMLIVPFLISWKVVSISLFAIALIGVPLMLLGRISYKWGRQNTETSNQIFAVLQENVGLSKLLIGMNNQNKFITSLMKAFDSHRDVTTKSQTLSFSTSSLNNTLGILAVVVIAFFGKKSNMPLSDMGIIIYAYLRIVPLVSSSINHKTSINNLVPAYEQVSRLRQRARDMRQPSGQKAFTGFRRQVLFDNVSYAYPDNADVLIDLNIMIPKGKMVAFVGKSGAGKSTLIDLLMGFDEPAGGKITIDGVSLQDFDVGSYRKRVGYVPQDSALFNMSIYDNLLWAKDDAAKNEVVEACRQANALEFIEELPSGFDTIVGDRGVRLSGGQIQRLALARAILRKPDILILDEATSSLDSHSERLIQASIEQLSSKTTVAVVAHRLSTIIKADYIYVLEKGRIMEEGTYPELISKNGYFKSMVEMQRLHKEN